MEPIFAFGAAEIPSFAKRNYWENPDGPRRRNILKIMRINYLALCIIALSAGAFLASRELALMPDERLHVYFFDVGQGDGALIVTPSGKQIVIDGGPAGGAMLRELAERMPFFDRTIDMLILSHPQLDHIFAFPEILRRYRVGRILMTGIRNDLPRYDEFLRLIKEQRIPIWIADPKKDIDLGDGIAIDVVWPEPALFGKKMKDVNNSSIMLRVINGTGAAVLFSGDAEEKEELAALASGADLSAAVLKAGHHGSKTSSGTGFLIAAHPSLAVISAGKNNQFGHPHAAVLNRMKALGIPIRVTGSEGTIEVAR
ncbi:MBL fold metallo-hydrolase [Candidatus Peregrinibacteria bacterium]|nr:MBL fold metallo-hydrolase [Candidatus Peregrinibacteria bacterium]